MALDLDYQGGPPTQSNPASRRTRRERAAWGAMVAVLALLALQGGGGTAPRDEDLSFVRTLLEIKGHLRQEYVRDLDDGTLRRAAINGMLELATDRYTQYVPPVDTKAFEDSLAGRFDGIGIIIESANADQPDFDSRHSASGGLVVVRPIPGSPAAAAGLLTGDLIVRVDGSDVRDMTQGDIADAITGPTGTRVALDVERTDPQTGAVTQHDFSVVRSAVQSPVLEGASRRPDGSPIFLLDPTEHDGNLPSGERPRIAYVRLLQFTPDSALKVLSTLEQLERAGGPLGGLILDLRNNPGGLLGESAKLIDLFIDEGVLVWSEGEHSPRRVLVANPQATAQVTRDLPLVVLVDRNSASASEVAAGALSDHGRATVVGERSYGKGSVQDIITLDDQGRLKVTTAYYHLPSGRIVDKRPDSAEWGIDPDVTAMVDVSNLGDLDGAGRDANGLFLPGQVWRAYEVLLAQLAARDRSGIWTPVPPVAAPTTAPARVPPA